MRTRTALCSALLALVVACEDEKPPAPTPTPAGQTDAVTAARLDPKSDAFVVTFVGERAAFTDANSIDAVPEDRRGMVRVKLLSGPDSPPGTVWVANLSEADSDGTFALTTFPRDGFEAHVLGLGTASAYAIPDGIEAPTQAPAPTDEVIVYKTSWCGACKALQAYLDKEGIAYVAKDIEADREAAAELKAKAAAQGVKTGSVPITDVRGTLVVGFNRDKIKALASS